MNMSFFEGVMGVFWNKTEVVVTKHCQCTKCLQLVHFKKIDFMCYEFQLFFKW